MYSDWNENGPCFLDCPNEITSSILLSCSTADHLSLSRVNKRLNAEANRLIYTKIQFLWTDKAKIPPVALFLRTILGTPQLARLVESLRLAEKRSFTNSTYLGSELPKLSWPGVGSTLDLAVGSVVGLQLPCTDDWVRGLQEGSMDAAIAVMLTHLPNLRSFMTTQSITKEMSLQGAVFRSILCEHKRVGIQQNRLGWFPRFDRLQYVSAESLCCNIPRSPNTDNLLPLFYLPAIQTLNFRLDNPARFSWPTATPPNLKTLTSLTLRNVRETALKGILSAAQRLVKLDWHFLYSEYNVSMERTHFSLYPPIADLDCLVDALTPVRNTLKDLTIRANATSPDGLEYRDLIEIRGSLNGLVEFNVERLQVPLPFLAGQLNPSIHFHISERLPRNLRTLVISRDLEEYLGMMMDEDDWDMDKITSNLLDWLCKGLGSTPFLNELDLGLFTANHEDSFYWVVKRQMEKERVPVTLNVKGVSWSLNQEYYIDTIEALNR